MKGKVYRGDFRREICFPVGGIGAGCIGLDGYGRLRDWEIFNRPNKLSLNGYSHFSVKVEQEGRVLDARVLNADLPPSYMGEALAAPSNFGHKDGRSLTSNYGFGPNRSLLSGMPHFRDSSFEGMFPFACVRFEDDQFPGEAALSAFNPFIPLDEDASSMPAAFYTVTLTNTLDVPAEFTAALSLGNPRAGLCRPQVVREGAMTGMLMAEEDADENQPSFFQLMMATDAEQVSWQESWFRGSWFDDLSLYWRDFTTPGPLKNRSYPLDPNWKERLDTATLAAHVALQPGETREVRFVIAWYAPTMENYWKPVQPDENLSNTWKNHYASLFSGVQQVARKALTDWDSLLSRTRRFADALHGSDLPEPALEAVCDNIAVLKTPTCLRLPGGAFYGFEGCFIDSGCCEGSCTHVWNYAFALPFLFPRLERSMRELDYTYNQADNGGMGFRLQLPLGRKRSSFRPCADGLMGGIIKFYRDWKLCGDQQWLKTWWPKVKKSLEYAWSPSNADQWDPDQTGVLTGRQHHTLDMELFGPNAWLNNFYLAALKAASEISEVLGEQEDAEKFARLYRQGRQFTEQELFNGEYFVQKIDLTDKALLEKFEDPASGQHPVLDAYWNSEAGQIKYQIQDGCGIDQVLAQWMSDLNGLGDILNPDMVRSALMAIYRHNFYPELRAHANPCRVYGLNDEAGTVICEWPEGAEKPVVPTPYSEETMHGFEYQAASHLIARGFEREGLEMVKVVRDRYDGLRRNPWNEMECGSNYARSMASYALLLIYSGFRYDMSRGRMGFVPLKGEGRFFWSLDCAWGTVEVRRDALRLTVEEGTLVLRELICAIDARQARLDDSDASFHRSEEGIEFDAPLTISSDSTLTIQG